MGFPVKGWPWNSTLLLSNSTTSAAPGPAVSTLWPVHMLAHTHTYTLRETHVSTCVHTIHTQTRHTYTHTETDIRRHMCIHAHTHAQTQTHV